ncbi:MAG TPA: NUDIX hydrolase [Candidatus Limnocylindrales bacterium]|nr:NUDIX hydrolase [Candidatus Limnocylindrales bacterium]
MTGPAIRAAGGVLWRVDPTDPAAVQVAVIHRPRYDDWSLPKGKLASGESETDCAIREVLEETGHHARMGRSLGETRYVKEMGGTARPKVVRWWAMEATSGAFVATREVDGLEWLSLGEAQERLTRETDRELLERFVRGPIPARTVLLVRHGSAGSRSRWKGDDRLRPLDECGFTQADELVRPLSHFDPTLIISADFMRCVQTVEPLARAMVLPVVQDPLLSELGYPGHEDAAVELVRSAGGEHAVLVACSQGDVIPDLLVRLAAADDIDLPDESSGKGSVWALTFHANRLVATEHFPPPDPPPCND